MPSETSRSHNAELVNRVKAILDRRDITVLRLSQLSEILFPQSPHFFVPHNFYYQLRSGTAVPNIYQLFAISKISNYRFIDWLLVFGYELDDLPRLETLLHGRRTVILDSSNYDKEEWVPWFRQIGTSFQFDAITPIVRIIAPCGARRIRAIEQENGKSFLYAKIGREDNLAYPHLVPGSIVRVDPLRARAPDIANFDASGRLLYMVEHSRGVTCCRLNRLDANHITLVSNQLPYANPSFRLDREIRILGAVDLEFRPLINVSRARVSAELGKPWEPAPIPEDGGNLPLGELIRTARCRTGLHFREASVITGRIAEHLGDSRFFIDPGALSSYERLSGPPRRIQKIMSLCIAYCIRFWDFIQRTQVGGLQSGQEPIPEDLLIRTSPDVLRKRPDREDVGHSAQLFPFNRFDHIPFFLRGVLSKASGLPNLSVRDIFWTGGLRQPLHPFLERSLFIIVNRRVKRPVQSPLTAMWEKPLYLVLMRDGTYICCGCVLKDDTLILQSYSSSSFTPRKVRNRKDAEIVGQVVFIVRRP
jgi:hypothetical protein